MKREPNKDQRRNNHDAARSPLPIAVICSGARIRANSFNSRKRPLFPLFPPVTAGFDCTTTSANLTFFGQIQLNPTQSDLKKNVFLFSASNSYPLTSELKIAPSPRFPSLFGVRCSAFGVRCSQVKGRAFSKLPYCRKIAFLFYGSA